MDGQTQTDRRTDRQIQGLIQYYSDQTILLNMLTAQLMYPWKGQPLSFLPLRDDAIVFLGHTMARCIDTCRFACASKFRHSAGTLEKKKPPKKARLQLDEHALKISKDLKKVVGFKAASCSTIRR